VTLAGILTSLRVRPSKKGDLWAAGVLEDLRGTAELLVFPQAFQQLRDVLKRDSALLIKGRVRHEENARPKVVVQEAKPLAEQVDGGREQVLIRIDLEHTSEGMMEELERVLASHAGESPIVFELRRPDDFLARVRARRPKGAKAEAALLDRLRELVGEEAVRIEPMNGKG
jgi:DNA polymerase-3 subunit alpha